MEKYFIVTPESPIYKKYMDYKEMSERVNDAFVDFAKEHGFETNEYYQSAQYLHICPTKEDTKKFGKYFKKDDPGLFKKNTPLAKEWVKKCESLKLTSPFKPQLGWEIGVYGKARSRLFTIKDIVYGSLTSDMDFKTPTGLTEIKASEFFIIVEEYEESNNA